MDAPRIIAIVLPLVAVQLVLMGLALADLTLPERRVRIASKLAWAPVIVIVAFLGPALYFMAGRAPE